jgi:hypothetical protein
MAEENDNFDSTIFDTEMRAMFEHMENIISTNEASKLKLNIGNQTTNPILRCLNQYKKFYEKSEPIDHRPYFVETFNKYRSYILKGYTFDTWLTQNNVFIQFGDGPKFNLNRLMLSACYNTALRLQSEAQKKVDGLPDIQDNNYPELIYPETFMLHLYRIFEQCCETEADKKKLAPLIAELEDVLGIDSGAVAESAPGTNGVGELIGTVLNKFGVKPPPGSSMPSNKEMQEVISGIFNNPQATNLIGNLFNQLQNCSDIRDVTKTLAENLSDPTLTEAIAGTIDNANLVNQPDQKTSLNETGKPENKEEKTPDVSGKSEVKLEGKLESKEEKTLEKSGTQKQIRSLAELKAAAAAMKSKGQ